MVFIVVVNAKPARGGEVVSDEEVSGGDRDGFMTAAHWLLLVQGEGLMGSCVLVAVAAGELVFGDSRRTRKGKEGRNDLRGFCSCFAGEMKLLWWSVDRTTRRKEETLMVDSRRREGGLGGR
jgi:hypothetical protein